MSTIIEVEKLKKTFRSFQLHDIAFHVSEGCITGLIGIDGSGKSTIIKCLINLIQRDSGKVEFWGENINDKNYSVMNRVGTILSGNEFYDGLTIRETKKIISGAYSNWNETVFQEYWARWKGRDCSEKQRLSTMSRQERVLLSIAIAVAHDSDVLILDEPFRGVDSVGCGKVLAILRDFVKTERRGILISSQDGMDISPVVDDLILIDDGSLVFHEEKDGLPNLTKGWDEVIAYSGVSFCICVLYNAIMIPATYKFGASKSRMVLLVIVAILPTVGTLIMKKTGIKLSTIALTPQTIVMLCLGGILVIEFVSFMLSIKIRKKRE